jgi:hypothetical protein
LIFWIQNIGLLAVPILIGWALTTSNPGVSEKVSAIGKINQSIEKNTNELFKSIGSVKGGFKDYNEEFNNGGFSLQHKNEKFAEYYFAKDSVGIKHAIFLFEQKYAFEKSRNEGIKTMELALNRLSKISSDTSVLANHASISPAIENLKVNIEEMKSISGEVKYGYTVTELIFASFGVLAIFLSFVLKAVDRRKKFGLDLPNKRD